MYFHELLARNPLQMITVMQSDINVKWFSLGKGDESEKKYIFCSKLSPQQSAEDLLELWITLYNVESSSLQSSVFANMVRLVATHYGVVL